MGQAQGAEVRNIQPFVGEQHIQAGGALTQHQPFVQCVFIEEAGVQDVGEILLGMQQVFETFPRMVSDTTVST